MVSQKQTIYYIINIEEKVFYFFEDHDKAKAKEIEIAEKYGYTTIMGHPFPKYPIQIKTLKKYYGTIYLAFKWKDSETVAYSIHDHWKNAQYDKAFGYTIRKVVLTPYEKFEKQFEAPEKENKEFSKEELESWRAMIE